MIHWVIIKWCFQLGMRVNANIFWIRKDGQERKNRSCFCLANFRLLQAILWISSTLLQFPTHSVNIEDVGSEKQHPSRSSSMHVYDDSYNNCKKQMLLINKMENQLQAWIIMLPLLLLLLYSLLKKRKANFLLMVGMYLHCSEFYILI